MKIRVTGYLDSEDIETSHLDFSDKTGLSEDGFIYYHSKLGLDDIDFEQVTDEPGEVLAQQMRDMEVKAPKPRAAYKDPFDG